MGGDEALRLRGTVEGLFDLSETTLAAEVGEFGAEDAAAALHGMAGGALASFKKEALASGDVARELALDGGGGEQGQEGGQRVEVGGGEGEGGHAGSGSALLDDVAQGLAGEAAAGD